MSRLFKYVAPLLVVLLVVAGCAAPVAAPAAPAGEAAAPAESGSAAARLMAAVAVVSIFPHLEAFPTNTMADAERWAADLDVPSYAIDEQTAIRVVDDEVDVVSEGTWRHFPR